MMMNSRQGTIAWDEPDVVAEAMASNDEISGLKRVVTEVEVRAPSWSVMTNRHLVARRGALGGDG